MNGGGSVVLPVIRGRSRDFPRQTPNDDGTYGGIYTGTEPITFTVWGGGEGPPLLSLTGPPNTWWDAALSQWIISLSDAQTASLGPGRYDLEVSAPLAAGRTGSLFRGILEVEAMADAVVSCDLATGWYVLDKLALGGLRPSRPQLASLPYLITAASDWIERYCARRFLRQVVVEDLEVMTYGQVRLSRPPIRRVLRMQADPTIVLQVSNRQVAAAWVCGDDTGGYIGGPAITGIALNWQQGGTTSSRVIGFDGLADQRVSSLAAAINGAGNGWWAEAAWAYGDLPIAELASLGQGVGATPDDRPDGYAPFFAYSRNLTNYWPAADNGEQTGYYFVGRLQEDSRARKWGPGGEMLWGGGPSGADVAGRVRATYDGGFRPIPPAVQLATAELVRLQLLRLSTDLLLKMEHAGEYRYELDLRWIDRLPGSILGPLQAYRLNMA